MRSDKEMWNKMVSFKFRPGSQSASRNSSELRQMCWAWRRAGRDGRQKEDQELNRLIKLLPHRGVCRLWPFSASARLLLSLHVVMFFSKESSLFNKIKFNYRTMDFLP